MAVVKIKGMNEIEYFPYSDLNQVESEHNRAIYEEFYRTLRPLCRMLHVELPDLAILDSIRYVNPLTGQMTQEVGRSITTQEEPALSNNIIIVSLEFKSPEYITAILAHEVRHFWQKKYHPEEYSEVAMGYGDSLLNHAEIDADGFAIYYIAKYAPMYIEKAARIVCPKEKKDSPKGFMKRIERAKEMQDLIDAMDAPTEPSTQKENFASKLRKFFTGSWR